MFTQHAYFFSGGGGRIRTYEGVSRQIYSLIPLTAREPLQKVKQTFFHATRGMSRSLLLSFFFNLLLLKMLNGAGNRNRTYNLLITNQLLCQLSYASIKFNFVSSSEWSKGYHKIGVTCYYLVPINYRLQLVPY